MSRKANHFRDGDYFTYCRLCDAQCGMVATVENAGVTRLRPNREHLHSRGHVCVKGIAFRDVIYDPNRVLYPLKRVGDPGEFARVSWEEALGDIAARLGAILKSDGPEALASYVGNPSAYSSFNLLYAMGFTAACGSQKLYSAASQDSAARTMANQILYGAPYPFLIPDLPQADVLFIFGGNPLVASGSILGAPRIFDDLNDIAKRGRVVVFDPRRTETARAYEHVFVRPGTDVWLIAAMIKILVREGWADTAFLDAHTTGYDRLFGILAKVDIEIASQKCGVPVATIEELAISFGRSGRAGVYGRVGVGRGRFSTLTNTLMDMLVIITGKFGKPGCYGFGFRLSKTASHDMHGADTPDPALTRIGNIPAVGGHMATAMLAADITEPGPGRVRAMMSMCGNPVLSAPNGAELASALEKLDLYFSIDFYQTETNRHADYILPATTFLEREDHTAAVTSLMVRPHLMATRAVIPPPGEAREEHEILSELTNRLGFGTPLPMVPMPPFIQELGYKPCHDDLADMVIRLTDVGDQYGQKPDGITMEKLLNEHPHGFPLEVGELLGETLEQISHADRRIHLCDDVLVQEFERFLGEANFGDPQFKLIGRRDIRSMNSWLHNSERLVRSQVPSLRINPDDAQKLNVGDGAFVILRSKTAGLEVMVEISDEMMPGVVSYPHGFGHFAHGWPRANAAGGANINLLASSDPADVEYISGSSFLDGIPVTIELVSRLRTH